MANNTYRGWGGVRYSAARMVPDFRWRINTRRNRWEYNEKEIDEIEWCLRRREKPGWHHGARTRNWRPDGAAPSIA